MAEEHYLKAINENVKTENQKILIEKWLREKSYPIDINVLEEELGDKRLAGMFYMYILAQHQSKSNKKQRTEGTSYKTPGKPYGRSIDEKRKDLVLENYRTQSYDQGTSPVTLLKNQLDEIIRKQPNRAPFLCLVQSTGYGKTRAVLELAKDKKLVYLVWKDMEGSWTVPPVLEEVLKDLKREENMSELDHIVKCERKWIKFLSVVKDCANKYNSANDLRSAQITETGELGRFYKELENAWKQAKTPEKSPLRTILKPGSYSASSPEDVVGSNNNEKKHVHYETAAAVTNESLIVCLDEVNRLPDQAYRTFRRAAKHEGILSLFADTATSICTLMPSNDHSSTLNGGKLGDFHPPVFALNTIDLHWLSEKPDDDYENLFYAGRPKWWSYYNVEKVNAEGGETFPLESLVDLAKNLLTVPKEDSKDCELTSTKTNGMKFVDPHKIAAFACRFSPNIQSRLSKLLAKQSLATVIRVSYDRDIVRCTYPSEPVLAEASAKYTSESLGHLETVLTHVMASFHDEMKLLDAPRGDLGEICAAALLGFMMDDLRKKSNHKYMSEPVPLNGLLAYFHCWPENDKIVMDVVEKWTINFTHFIRISWSPGERDLSYMWKRRMAYYMPIGFAGVDILIPIKYGEDSYGTLCVQVKNYSRKIWRQERDDFFGKLLPKRCLPSIPDEYFSVGLLLSLGKIEECCRVCDHNGEISEGEVSENAFLQLATSFPNPDEISKVSQSLEVATRMLQKINGSTRQENVNLFYEDVHRHGISSMKIKRRK